MRSMWVGLMAAGMVLASAAAARADLLLVNKSGQSVQYTIYDGSGQPISGASGCMRSDMALPFGGTNYASGHGIYIRGIMKARTDCTGNSQSDTGRGSRILLNGPSTVKTFINFSGRLIVQ